MSLKSLAKSAEQTGKNLLRQTLVRIIPRPRTVKTPLDAEQVRHVLAVRHDARLGNLLLLTPALQLIQCAFPNAKIDALISGRYGDALAFNPDVQRVLTTAHLPRIFFSNGYDLAFDFSPQHAFSLSSAAWTALSRAKTRVGFERGDAAAFLNFLVPALASHSHETTNLCSLVLAAAPWTKIPAGEQLRPRWHFGPDEREQGEKLWRDLGLDQESLAFFLGGRREKQLPLDWFLGLARSPAASGRKVALLAGPAEQGLLAAAKIPTNAVIAPEMPLRLFAAFLANARAVAMADTGPMHLAAALNRPCLAFFTHTEPWRFGYAWLPNNLILEAPSRTPDIDQAANALNSLLTAI